MASIFALSVASPPICLDFSIARASNTESRKISDSSFCGKSSKNNCSRFIERRKVVITSIGILAGLLQNNLKDGIVVAAEFADMPAIRGKDYGKSKMRFPDYTETESGLQYKDLRVGNGPKPNTGEMVVVDWDGYTIGYYGRIFEARNKTKGGSFEGADKDFFKFRVGSQEVIPAFEEAVSGMALGGIRRIIVPPELGYPENDFNKRGPRPTTFSVIVESPFSAIIQVNSEKDAMQICFTGPTGFGFCAKEPRADRQDPLI